MSRKSKITIVLLVVIGIVVYGGYKFYWMFTPHRGAVFETKELASNSFRIRVSAYEENGTFLPGAYYIFESSPVGSNEWREIINIRADDPQQIPHDAAAIVDQQIGYVYLHNVYAVTRDEGRTWTLWDAMKELHNRRDIFSRSIENVQIGKDGTGTMRLHNIPDREPVIYLLTTNYGQSWSIK